MRILHCLRAPVGGLFRHVIDLSREQAAAGHEVGAIADRTTADSLTQARLEQLRAHLTLGLFQIPMSRSIGPRDVTATMAIARIARRTSIEVLHGHGAKGGAYARLATALLSARRIPVSCFYTPHGGSLHYPPTSLNGRIYMALERHLLAATTGIIFESDFSRRTFTARIGPPTCAERVIPNGVLESEFTSHQPDPDATDFLFVGELRTLKGVDVLLRALARLRANHPVTATIVGDGPDKQAFETLAGELNIDTAVHFPGAMPVRTAFRRGRILVVPSRAESLPYIVLEAAAGSVPLIATSVGGIPEIVQGTATNLIPADDVTALAAAMGHAYRNQDLAAQQAAILQNAVRARFTVATMSHAIEQFYDRQPASLTTRDRSLTYL